MKILMCRPDFYGIKYEINPWMKISKQANHELAVQQWQQLHNTLSQCGADILLVPPQPQCPDMTFTANAGMLYHKKIILSHFKYKERQVEAPYFESWFKQAGFEVLNTVSEHDHAAYFEGAGDALNAGEHLFAGYGFRSEITFYQQAKLFAANQITTCELVDPYYYHLDTCFCPLNDTLALWYPPAFSKKTQARMREQINLIDVIADEASLFACNAIAINNQVILPSGCKQTAKSLVNHGFTVHHCDMSEYLKAGGACKCLTLRLD